MFHRLFIAMLAALAPSWAGCLKERSPEEEHLNSLWRQGYGFNNPNVDRIRQGKPPLDFHERQGR